LYIALREKYTTHYSLHQGSQPFRQAGHTERYVTRARAFKYLYLNQHKTEHYNKNSLNLPINMKLGPAFAP